MSDVLTIDEAADRLRVSRWTVYNLIRSNQLRSIKIGRRHHRMPRPAHGGGRLMSTTTTTTASPDEPRRRKPAKRRSRRRANGEGTIVQRKDGRYEAKVFVPTTAGTFKRLSVYGKTREECHAKYVKLKAQADDGIPVASESWTIEQYLTHWLEHIVRVERRPKTYQGYEGVVRRYLIPELGKKRLGKLTARDVRLFITRVREACQCCRHGWEASREIPRCCAKPSPNAALVGAHGPVHPRGPTQRAGDGSARGDRAAQRRQAGEGHHTQVQGQPRAVRRPSAGGARCRVRRAAVRALRPRALSRPAARRTARPALGGRQPQRRHARSRPALQRVGGELRFVRPKTDDSQRTIPLPTICVDALQLHKERQKAERADAWPNWKDNDLAFPSRLGTPLEPDNLRRSWGRIRKAASLGDVRFHDIRHTCVSLLLDLGVPPHIVRDIVGHSDIEVTMTIYAHAALDEKRKALRKLGDALG